MKFIDEDKINQLLDAAPPTTAEIDAILAKCDKLQRLTVEECSKLIKTEDPVEVDKIYKKALEVKNRIYGKRIVLFAPLYISNICSNNCLYCGFRTGNKTLKRVALTPEQITQEAEVLLKQGHMRILMVAGESNAGYATMTDYFLEGVKAIYKAQYKKNRIKRVNVNLPSMPIEDLKRIKEAGVGTYQLFQETYHEETYKKMHVSGKKTDMGYRLEAFDRAFLAGIDDVGMGVLYGLYDWRFETLALMQHVEYLEKKFGVGPHTLSVPRLQEAPGAPVANNIPYPLKHEDMKRIVAVLRLTVPYTGIILSTREEPNDRDELIALGASQVSAGSSVTPGGYSSTEEAEQFEVHDPRSLETIVTSLMEHGYIPSFCAACYRKARTGEHFMELAKPGTIQHMCAVNAIATLQEYLDDYASDKTKREAAEIIKSRIAELDPRDAKMLSGMLEEIGAGKRDVYR